MVERNAASTGEAIAHTLLEQRDHRVRRGTLMSYIEQMRELYMREYSALVPEWHRPRFEQFRGRYDELERAEQYASFFNEDQAAQHDIKGTE